jgi:hypothetical protein
LLKDRHSLARVGRCDGGQGRAEELRGIVGKNFVAFALKKTAGNLCHFGVSGGYFFQARIFLP